MVTTVQRPKKKKQTSSSSSTTPPLSSSPSTSPYETKKPPERSGDLASRLAAAVNDKPRSPDMKKINKDTTSLPRSSTESANTSESDSKQPATSETVKENDKVLDEKEVSTTNEEDLGTTTIKPVIEAAKDDTVQSKEDEESNDSQLNDEEQKESKENTEQVKKEEDQPMTVYQEDDVEKDTKQENVDVESSPKSNDKEDNEQQVVTSSNSKQSVDIPEIKTNNKDTILQQREAQLFQAMQNIAQLHDQIHNLQEQAEKERRGYEDRIKELSSRPASGSGGGGDARSVKKLESTIEDLQRQLKGKNEQIQGLMEEGTGW